MHQVRSVWLGLLLMSCGGGGASTGDGGDPAGPAVESQAFDAGHRTDAGVQTAPTDAGPPATFTAIYAALFPATTNARCNFCHSMPASDTSNGLLSVGATQASAYAALVNKTSNSSQCGGMPLVVPGDPEASLFWLKLTDPPPCGSRMPLGGSVLTAALLQSVRSWISAGAKDD